MTTFEKSVVLVYLSFMNKVYSNLRRKNNSCRHPSSSSFFTLTDYYFMQVEKTNVRNTFTHMPDAHTHMQRQLM